MPTIRAAGVAVNRGLHLELYMVSWPPGMNVVMQRALDECINRDGVLRGLPGILLRDAAFHVLAAEYVAKAVSDVRP